MRKVVGDLLDVATEGVIIHQVNCQNAMGSGFAKAFYTKYPKIKKLYHAAFESFSKENLYGNFQEIELTKDLIGVNSFTQFYYGNDKDIKFTNETKLIDNINKVCLKYHNKKVYIPGYIGAGLGNGEWDLILNSVKHNHNLVVVYLKK